MKTKTINIRKLTADEGKIIVSKKYVLDEEVNIEYPEVCTKELFLGVDALEEDYEEVSESDMNALFEKLNAARNALAEERLKELEASSKEASDDSN